MRLPFRLLKYSRIVFIAVSLVIASLGSPSRAFAFDQSFFAGNDILFYDPTSCPASGQVASTSLVGADNVAKAFNYFTGKGLTAAQAAGIVGNLMQESNVNPRSVEAGGPGRGIAQWSVNDRWAALQTWAAGKDIYDLGTQLDFMWHEMNDVAPWNQSLTGSTSPDYPSLKTITADTEDAAVQAGHSFGYLYERFGTSGARDQYSGQVWTTYHAQTGTATNDPRSGSCAAQTTGTCQNAPPGWVQDTNKVVDIACQEWNKKVIEDAGNNCDTAGHITIYAKATGFGSCGEPYCGMFVGYVYKTAGMPFPSSAGVASVPSLYSYLGSIGARRDASETPKPGDVIIYGSDYYHTGLVVGVGGGYVTSIEGNTGPDPSDKANPSSLQGVHMHHRPLGAGNDAFAWGDFDTLATHQGPGQ